MDYKEKIKERLRILPDDLKDFVLEDSWRKDAEKIGSEFGLDTESYTSLENEIFLTLIFFEPRISFNENIQKELGIDSVTAGWITEDVEKYIFNKVSNILDEIDQLLTKSEIVKKEGSKPPNNIGSSFEQIILNQAIAMQPARDASPDSANMAGGPAIEIGDQTQTHSQVPENLPIEDVVSETPQEPTESDSEVRGSSYSNQDPYREPIE